MGKVNDLKKTVSKKDEAGVDIQKVIKALIDTDFGSDDAEQAKAAQLFKGLAFSKDPKSTEFMKAVSDAVGKLKPEDFA